MSRVNRLLCAGAVVLAAQVSGPAAFAQRGSTPDQDLHPPTVQEQDAVLGAWALDLSRSTFVPGPPPRGEVRTYQQEHEGIKAEILTTQADGQVNRIEYIASYNDVVALVTGSKQTDAIRLKRVDAYTAESQLALAGTIVGHATRTISRDGNTMTITFERTAPTAVKNVEVYRRIMTQ
jgi:hypothetical protein